MNSERIDHIVYLLFACNTTIGQSSLRPIGASTSLEAFCAMIASCVFNGNMEYRGKKRLEGFRLFHRDYRNKTVQFSALEYGHVEQMRDGILSSAPHNKVAIPANTLSRGFKKSVA